MHCTFENEFHNPHSQAINSIDECFQEITNYFDCSVVLSKTLPNAGYPAPKS